MIHCTTGTHILEFLFGIKELKLLATYNYIYSLGTLWMGMVLLVTNSVIVTGVLKSFSHSAQLELQYTSGVKGSGDTVVSKNR